MNTIYTAIISFLAGIIFGIIIGIWTTKKEETYEGDYYYGDYL